MTTTLPLLPDTGVEPDDQGLGMLTCDSGWLPLAAVDIDADVTGLNASVTVRQSFHNPFPHPIEATYIYPLPDRAAVTAFTMTIGDRKIEGMLKERGEARATYDQAIASGHRAAITEEERPDVFTTRVGNLQPGDRADVELILAQPLPWEDGQAAFRFPLVVAPRHIPGQPIDGEQVGDGIALDTDAVPDASRISPPVLLPGLPNPVRLGLRVRFGNDSLPPGLAASLHTVDEGGSEVALRPGERLDRDFILRWGASGGDTPAAALALAPDPSEDGGTFTFTLLPPFDESGTGPARRPRDVVVVLDRSGSMGGWKMVAARRAAARIIDTLSSVDRFSILAFDNAVERPAHLAEGLVPASDRNRWLAVEWLAKLDARGGTELAGPLTEALNVLNANTSSSAAPAAAGGDRQASCLVVTDGQVGNEDQILATLAPLVLATRIFTVGIDRAVNAGFLKRLAAAGGGRCELVESDDRLDEVMTAVHRRIAAPALEAVKLEPVAGDIDELSPAGPADCFAGVPLVVRGRYRGSAPQLRWSAAGLEGTPAGGTVSGVEAVDAAARPLWARSRIRDLEDGLASSRYDRGVDRERLAERIVELSLATGVLSRFTAFVAVDRSERFENGAPAPVVQPVELPSGWQPGAAGSAMPMALAAPASGAMSPAFGAMPLAGAPAPSPMSPPGLDASGEHAMAPGAPPGAARGRFARLRPGMSTPRQPQRRPQPPPPADHQVPRPDLSRYLERLEELLAQAETGETGPTLRRELGELLGDLRSVGSPEPLVGAVDRLLVELGAGRAATDSIAAVRLAIGDARSGAPGSKGADGGGADRRRRFWR
jgi:Ca-activated chloride channel family protein